MKKPLAAAAIAAHVIIGTAGATDPGTIMRVMPGTTVYAQFVGMEPDDVCPEYLTNGDLGRIEVTFAHCDEGGTTHKRTLFDDGSGYDRNGRTFCLSEGTCTPSVGDRKPPRWAIRRWNRHFGG